MKHTAGLVLIGLFSIAQDAAAEPLPAPAQAATDAVFAECREAGGIPSVTEEYASVLDLNGDGQPDYVLDLMGLACESAWSYFCGSAGCPVTVWLSGPEGHFLAQEAFAQAWQAEGSTITYSLHHAACGAALPASGVCERSMDFAGMTKAER